MKKLICLILVLWFATSTPLSFSQPLLDIERRNYIVQREYQLDLLVPALAFCGGAGWLFAEAEDAGTVASVMACVLTFTGLAFLIEAITPKETFWFPKMDADGTIWFRKKILEWR